MTLDTYADFFEDDLGSVADRLNERVLAESGGDLWSDAGTVRGAPGRAQPSIMRGSDNA